MRTFRIVGLDVVHIDANIPYGPVGKKIGAWATPGCNINEDYVRPEVITYDDPEVDVAPNCIACIVWELRRQGKAVR